MNRPKIVRHLPNYGSRVLPLPFTVKAVVEVNDWPFSFSRYEARPSHKQWICNVTREQCGERRVLLCCPIGEAEQIQFSICA